MIYDKDASFSYPVLSNTNDSYQGKNFTFEIISITDDKDNYYIEFQYEIESEFINDLISKDKAVLIFILQSKDNSFFILDNSENEISIPKSRVSFSENARAQLHIQSTEEVQFESCSELNRFYDEFKDNIKIKSKSLLGYSNITTMRNTGKQGIGLFEREVDPNMDSEFEIVLNSQNILLRFKDGKHLLQKTHSGRDIINLYIYLGLSRALSEFLKAQLGERTDEEEIIYIDEINEAFLTNLDHKLFNLMKSKGIEVISYNNIDSIIQLIAPQIVGRFTKSVERLVQ